MYRSRLPHLLQHMMSIHNVQPITAKSVTHTLMSYLVISVSKLHLNVFLITAPHIINTQNRKETVNF